MSLGSAGSTGSDEPPRIIDARFNNAVHNISRLFDRISAIENELLHGQEVMSKTVPHDVWSISSMNNEPAASRSPCSNFVPSRRCNSLPDDVSLSKIENFQAEDAEERRKYLQLDLERLHERARAALRKPTTRSPRKARQPSRRRSHHALEDAESNVAKEEIRNLTRANGALRKQNQTMSLAKDQLGNDLRRLKNRLSILRAENVRLTENMKTIQTQNIIDISNEREQTRRAEVLHVGTRAELSQTQSKLASSLDRVRELENQLGETRDVNRKLSAELNQLRAENSKTLSDLMEMERRLTQIEEHRKSPKLAPVVDHATVHLVNELSAAKNEALTAKMEAQKYAIQLEELRGQYTAALNKERQLRRKAIEQECFSILSKTGRLDQTSQSVEFPSAGTTVYLKRIRKLQNTVNELNDRIAEFEKRELKRAPVVVRRRKNEESSSTTSAPRVIMTFSSPHTSYLSDDETLEDVREGPTEYEASDRNTSN